MPWAYFTVVSPENSRVAQARREPQRGPGKHYRGALSPPLPHSVYLEIDTPKASRGRKHGELLSPHHPNRGLGEPCKLPSGVRGGVPAENGLYAYFRSERSHLKHNFQYF